jgi:6-phosphogluconolactonase
MRAFIRGSIILLVVAAAGCGGRSFKLTPIGFLFTVGQNSNNAILGFQQLSDGELINTALPSTPTNPRPVGMTLHPSKNFLYVTNFIANTVSGFNIDHTSGALAPVGTAVSPSPTGPAPVALGTDSAGKFLYVLTQGSATVPAAISVFSIDQRGLLTAAAGSVAAPASPLALVVSPAANFLYVAAANTINVFSIATDGSLNAAAGGFTAPAGSNIPQMVIEPKGKFLYAPDSINNAVFSFSIGADGSLTPVAGSPFAAGTQPVSVAVDTGNQFLYTANEGSNDISAYTISSGALTQVKGSPFASTPGGTTPAQPVFLTVDASNQFVYIGNQGPENISAYNINAVDGTLVAVKNMPFFGVGASSIIATK